MLEVENLSKEYTTPAGPLRIVSDVSLSLPAGAAVSIMGPSGSGKSTLLYMLGGLDRPTRGEVLIDGVSTTGLADQKLADLRNAKVGFVFQFHFLLPELTALGNVALPMRRAGLTRRKAEARAGELLAKLGIASLGHFHSSSRRLR